MERGFAALNIVTHDKQVLSILDGIVAGDPQGRELATWYQFFFGRRFREGSGKFFTPRTIAAAMARLLPVQAGAILLDPTCGGGTFLSEASRRWADTPCRLVGNDVDRMLVGLTELVLALSPPLTTAWSSRASIFMTRMSSYKVFAARFTESWPILHFLSRSNALRNPENFLGLGPPKLRCAVPRCLSRFARSGRQFGLPATAFTHRQFRVC